MKFLIIVSFLTSIVHSQNFNGFGSSLRNVDISISDNVGYANTADGGSSSVNSIIISGNSEDQRKPHNDLNSVRISGQNGGAASGPLRINLRNNHGSIGSPPAGSYRASVPNYNVYPQNNAYANRRPEYYPITQQIRAPASLRPSFQYPGIRNSLNNGNDYFKNIIPGGGGLSLPFPYLWG